MAFDPSVIASIGDNTPDITGSKAKAYTLADMMDRNQLMKGQVADDKQNRADTEAVRSILKKSDISTYEGKLKAGEQITKVNPRMGMEFVKESNEAKSQSNTLGQQQYELLSAKNEVIGSAAVSLKLQHDDLVRQGRNPAEVNAAMMPQMMQTLKQLEAAKLPDGSPVLNEQDRQNYEQQLGQGYNPAVIDAIVARSKQADAVLKNKLAERHETNTEAATAEREHHDRALESTAQQRVDISKVKLERDQSGGLTTKTAQMLAEQAAAGDTTALQGLKPADKIKVRNVMADNAAISGTTGADQAAKNAEFQGIKAGERTLGQRQANIDMAVQEAQNIMPILRDASKNVPRGKFTTWNKLFQIADGEVSDPDLLQFAQAAKSFANIYTRATVPGASSVFDREEAVKHLPIFTSDESFQKVLDIMDKEMAAAKASPHQVRQDLANSVTGSDRQTLPTAPPAGARPAPAALPPRPGQPPAGGPGAAPPPPPGFQIVN